MDNIDLVFAKIGKGADLKRERKSLDKKTNSRNNIAKYQQLNKMEILEKVKSGKIHISNLSLEFERRYFFDHVFSILFPYNILEVIKEEKDYIFSTNNQYNITFITKVLHQENRIDIETLKAYYKEQMSKSKQKTIFDLTGNVLVGGNEILYFSVIHPMPMNKLFNFMLTFKAKEQNILITLSGVNYYYDIWKNIMMAMLQTIEIKGEI